MASIELVENLCNRINGPSRTINTKTKGIGPASVDALGIYMGHNPEDTSKAGNHELMLLLYTQIAGLILEPTIHIPGRDYSLRYWEDKVAKEVRNPILQHHAGEMGIDLDEEGKKVLQNNLTNAIRVLAMTLTEGGTIINMTEAEMRYRLGIILADAWYKTHREPLILPNPLRPEQ